MMTTNEDIPIAAETCQIAVRNFNFYYGKYHALKNIGIEVSKQRITAFIGPSGCGKSTLLRTLNRMYDLYPEQRAEGEILFNGHNILGGVSDLDIAVAILQTWVSGDFLP
ncbi:hypothetical protein CCP3SC1_300010 [Gammaproteobacteria bacterium]